MAVSSLEPDTIALIRRGKEGDKHALNILFARYQGRVLRIVRLRLNAERREKLKVQSMDILQEVFLHALRKVQDFEPTGEGAFLHWLSRIVENVIRDELDHVAAQKRASAGECSLDQTIGATENHLHFRDLIPYEGTSPTQHVMKRDIESVVDNLLLELDEPEREVIIQRKMEGLTFGEIASDLGKTEDAVRKQFNRSYRKLVTLAENRKVLQELRF